jgi:hypothetical protein
MSGNVSVTPNTDGTYSGTITLTISGQSYSGSFVLTPVTHPNVPNPPTATVGNVTQTSISINLGPPASGPALDQGNYRVNYKPLKSTTWITAFHIPYNTPTKGTITDTRGNKWTLNASGNPVVNGHVDTASHAKQMMLVGNAVWQEDTANTWYSCTPTGSITSGSVSWSAGTQTSPMSNLTITGLTAGTDYDVQATVSNSSGNSAPVDDPISTAGGTSTGGTGPTAQGDITVAFDQPFNYPRGSGQQYVSQRMYGVGTGGAGDNNFGIFANADFRKLCGQVNPGMWMFKNSGQAYWNNDLSIRQDTLANLINNFHECDPLSVSGVFFSIDWGMVPGGDGNPTQYANGIASLAKYLNTAKMSNGAPFPLLGFIGHDEPDGQGEDNVAAYYRAFGPAVKAVSPSILVAGPQTSYIQWTDFANKAPIDVLSYNYFQGGDSRPVDDMSWVTNNQWAAIAQSAAGAAGNLKATMMGGYGLDWDCGSPADNAYPGALFAAQGFIDSLNNAKLPFWPCKWDAQSDGTCGVITGPNQAGQYYGVTNQIMITPKGYFMAEGVRKIYGLRVQTPKVPAKLRVLAVTPDKGRASVMVVNTGAGNQNVTIGMSKWPVNTTGNASANVWQMDSSVKLPGVDGKRSTVQVVNGVAGPINFPDPSVTIVSI